MQGYYENHRDDMIRAHAWYACDDHCTPHFHNSVELVYVLSGELFATLDGETCRVGPGMMLINSSYTIHAYETPDASESIIAIIPMTMVPSVHRLLSNQSFAATLCEDDEAGALGTLMKMMVEFCCDHPLSVKGLCYAVLGLLIDRVGLVEARPGSRTAFVRQVLDFLQERYTEPLSLQRVADHFGYSRSRFSHIFCGHLGCTLPEYVSSLRCRHAAQLLRETDVKVSEAGMAAGFESLRTFYRAFQKQYKMTPNQYAKGSF